MKLLYVLHRTLVKNLCFIALKKNIFCLYDWNVFFLCFLVSHHLHASFSKRTALSKGHAVPVKIVLISGLQQLREDSKFGLPVSYCPSFQGDFVGRKCWYSIQWLPDGQVRLPGDSGPHQALITLQN